MGVSGTPEGDGDWMEARGYYTCTYKGSWAQLNISGCHFEREVTRVLHQYCKVRNIRG